MKFNFLPPLFCYRSLLNPAKGTGAASLIYRSSQWLDKKNRFSGKNNGEFYFTLMFQLMGLVQNI